MVLPNSRSDREYQKFVDKNNEVAVRTSLYNDDGKIDVQNPLPTNGDSVYAKDIIMDLSDPGNFIITTNPTATEEEILTSMVSDVHIEKKDDTSNNPKSITLTFKRPIVANSFGIDSGPNGTFSNTKITIFQGQFSQVITDESTDNTKYTIKLFPTPPIKFSKILIEFYTADTVTTGLIGIFKAIEVTARLQGVSTLTGNVEDVSTYRETLNVNSAYVHRKLVNQFFHRHTGVTTNPTIAITSGDTNITVASTTGFSIGNELKIEETINNVGVEEVGILNITNIVGNVITLDRPIGENYTIVASVEQVTTEMAVNGSLASPIIFEIDPPFNTVWQLLQWNINIIDNLEPDDSKFGGIAALTNGVTFRAITQAGRTALFANWKRNGDIKLDAGDISYSDKAGGGNYSAGANWFAAKNEVAAEIDGSDPIQKIEVLIQDDLTDLVSLQIKSQGRVFSP